MIKDLIEEKNIYIVCGPGQINTLLKTVILLYCKF